MTKHDDIQMRIKDNVIKKFVIKYFGEKGTWASKNFHSLHEKNVDEWSENEIRYILKSFSDHGNYLKYESGVSGALTLGTIKHIAKFLNEQASAILINDSILIKYTKEHPLTKGEGQYKTTKGFLDLVIHAKSNYSRGLFDEKIRCYKEENTKEFIVEIKTNNDWNDLGSVLRQIKEYQTYYTQYNSSGCWNSDLLKDSRLRDPIIVICSDTIPQKAKDYFKENNIEIWELGEELELDEDTKWWYGDEE